MKKHPFLHIDLRTSVRFTPSERASIGKSLTQISEAAENLIQKKKIILRTGKVSSITLSLLICGDKRIKMLNQEYRSKNKVTDVLSFPFHEDLHKLNRGVIISGEVHLGDVVICHSLVKKQAKEFDIRYQDEFTHLLVHGLFHLLGYDHEISQKEEKRMQDMEEELLKEVSKLKKKGS